MVWLDNARIIAILAVVMLHVAADFVFDYPVGDVAWWVGNVYDSAVRWCVPLFVMISGALLLDPSKNEPLKTFYSKRVSRLLVPLLFWTLVYLAWRVAKGVVTGNPESVSSLLGSVLDGTPYYHLWFLYMIVGLYLFTPFMRMVVAQASTSSLWVLVAAGMVMAAVNSLYSKISGVGDGLFINWFLLYVPYFFLGYLLRHSETYPSRKSVIFTLLTSIPLTAVGFYLLAIIAGKSVGLYFYDYLSVTVIPMSVAVFWLFKAYKQPIGSMSMTKSLAALTLGVYLIHPMFLELFNFLGIGATAFPAIVSIPVFTLLIYVLSLAAAWVMSKLPFIKRCI